MSDYSFSISIDSSGVPKLAISYYTVESTADGFRAMGKMCEIAAGLMDSIESKAAHDSADAARRPHAVSGAERLSSNV